MLAKKTDILDNSTYLIVLTRAPTQPVAIVRGATWRLSLQLLAVVLIFC